MSSIYHEGEISVQKKAGEYEQASSVGRMVASTIIRGAYNFIEKQPMAIVSSADPAGHVWATLLIGDYGFVSVDAPDQISMDTAMIHSSLEDVFFDNIRSAPGVGTLFIELASRRRFRINGAATIQGDRITVGVTEAYPNCPKYIQQRNLSRPDSSLRAKALRQRGETLTPALQAWIVAADTLFVGSRSAAGNMDVSHRGGPAGFVEVLDPTTLKIPDYRGNSMYNTLGNLVQNPNAGLLLIDFAQRKTLQLTGTAEVLFDQNGEEDLRKTTGTGRFWTFRIKEWIETSDHHAVDWEFDEDGLMKKRFASINDLPIDASERRL